MVYDLRWARPPSTPVSASVAKRQLLVSFSRNASGPVAPLDILRLMRAGSVFLTRPTLFDHIATTEMLDEAAAELFQMIDSGAVKIEIGQEWALKDIREAHKALESRETVGTTLLIPSRLRVPVGRRLSKTPGGNHAGSWLRGGGRAGDPGGRTIVRQDGRISGARGPERACDRACLDGFTDRYLAALVLTRSGCPSPRTSSSPRTT